jgi:hypothetical protein
MDDLDLVIDINGGYVTRAQLNEIGYSDTAIRVAVRVGRLRRIRHGVYALAASWNAMSTVERHCVLARAVLDKLGPGVVASHHTAAALHGFDLHGIDLTTVHVTRLDGRPGRNEAGVVHHHGLILPEQDVREVQDLLVVEPTRAVFEACSLTSVEGGMVVASSALRSLGISQDELMEAGARFQHWQGMRRARLAIRLSDGRLETVGEVRSLHMMWRHGIPYPELQFVVEVDGRIVARTDFAWLQYRHTGEFDGMQKYGRLNPFSHDPGLVLQKEKVREDLVRGQQLGMSRWGWADLEPWTQRSTAETILQSMERSRKLYTRNGVVIPLS